MTPVRWAFALEFGKVGGRSADRLVSHLFAPTSVTPLCLPRQPGTPASLEEHLGWRCEACERMGVRVTWSHTTLGRSLFWTLHVNGGAAVAEGTARDEHDAIAQVLQTAEKSLPMGCHVVLSQTSARYAEEVARDRRAEKRAERPGQVGVFQETRYLYRHEREWDWSTDGYVWKTERAPITKTTTRRVFVEHKVRQTAKGATVLTTFALERDVLEKHGKCRGWTFEPTPPNDGTPAVGPSWAKTLGVAAGCSLADARQAYRRKAAETHPDRGGTAAAFQRVTSAWGEAKRALGGEPFGARP